MAEAGVAIQSGTSELDAACRELAARARSASKAMAIANGAAKDAWLVGSAAALVARADEILEANARDVEAAPGLGLNAAAEVA